MTIPEIKEAQEKALRDFAYYTGMLTYAGGIVNEPDAPKVEFPDSRDYQRLSPIWNRNHEQGFRDGKTRFRLA